MDAKNCRIRSYNCRDIKSGIRKRAEKLPVNSLDKTFNRIESDYTADSMGCQKGI
jgi:hypothetical protein